MKVRAAQIHDLDQIMIIIHQAQSDLKMMNVDQWQNGYPNEKVILKDIMAKKAYVLYDESVLGLMVCSIKDETTYDPLLTWKREDYLVIHRFAVHQKMQRKGLASFMIQEAVKMAKELHLDSLRIDTHEKNVKMRRFLEKNQFEERGIIYLKDGNPRIGYELLF